MDQRSVDYNISDRVRADPDVPAAVVGRIESADLSRCGKTFVAIDY